MRGLGWRRSDARPRRTIIRPIGRQGGDEVILRTPAAAADLHPYHTGQVYASTEIVAYASVGRRPSRQGIQSPGQNKHHALCNSMRLQTETERRPLLAASTNGDMRYRSTASNPFACEGAVAQWQGKSTPSHGLRPQDWPDRSRPRHPAWAGEVLASFQVLHDNWPLQEKPNHVMTKFHDGITPHKLAPRWRLINGANDRHHRHAVLPRAAAACRFEFGR